MQWALFHLPMLLAADLTAFWVFMNIGLVNAALVKPAEREGQDCVAPDTNHRLQGETFVLTHLLGRGPFPLQVFYSGRPSLVLPKQEKPP